MIILVDATLLWYQCGTMGQRAFVLLTDTVLQRGNPVPSPTEKKPYAVIADHPSPQYLAPNAVRIRIAASGLNFADALQVMARWSPG